MPYELRMVNGKHCVFNKDTGDNKGCSDSHEMAVKHMRALYAVESGSMKSFNAEDIELLLKDFVEEPTEIADSLDPPQPSTTSEVSVENPCNCLACVADDDEGPYKIKAAMTRASINDLPDSEFAYIEPNCDTKSCRHFPIHDKAHVRNALARLSQSPFGPKAKAKVMAAAKRMGIEVQGNKSFIDKILGQLRPVPPVSGGPLQVIRVKQDNQERMRVLMRVSNMFKDRHGEIITSEAHADYVQWVMADKSSRMPEFWLWHIKGSRWGRADFIDFSDGFLTMSGLVDKGFENLAENLSDKSAELGVSHGFIGVSINNKSLIDIYRSIEASPLPKGHAANLWTAFMQVKEDGDMTPEQRKWLVDDLGVPDAVADKWGQENKELRDLLKDNGIAYKSEEPTTEDGPTLSDVMAKLVELDGKINATQASVVQVEEKQKEFEKKSEDIVASTLEAAVKAGATPQGFVASKSDDNKVTPEKAKEEQDDWFNKLVVAPAFGVRS